MIIVSLNLPMICRFFFERSESRNLTEAVININLKSLASQLPLEIQKDSKLSRWQARGRKVLEHMPLIFTSLPEASVCEEAIIR
jgi:hypothetical protein